MLSWILGIENSFSKSLLYVTLVGSALTIFGSLTYLLLVGGPMAANKYLGK